MSLLQYLKETPVKHKVVPVPMPEWGDWDGQVFVKTITTAEWAVIQEMEDNKRGTDQVLLSTIIGCVCNNKGELYFENSPVVREHLGAEPIGLILRLAQRAREINGIDVEDEAAEIEGN